MRIQKTGLTDDDEEGKEEDEEEDEEEWAPSGPGSSKTERSYTPIIIAPCSECDNESLTHLVSVLYLVAGPWFLQECKADLFLRLLRQLEPCSPMQNRQTRPCSHQRLVN